VAEKQEEQKGQCGFPCCLCLRLRPAAAVFSAAAWRWQEGQPQLGKWQPESKQQVMRVDQNRTNTLNLAGL
jgi:hypothetical protein